ncbi:hypothetical protein J2X69_003858 [Algoriphagus sp. 4150]|nr:hypothetical protein [Algoriphagus sp. 4150]
MKLINFLYWVFTGLLIPSLGYVTWLSCIPITLFGYGKNFSIDSNLDS